MERTYNFSVVFRDLKNHFKTLFVARKLRAREFSSVSEWNHRGSLTISDSQRVAPILNFYFHSRWHWFQVNDEKLKTSKRSGITNKIFEGRRCERERVQSPSFELNEMLHALRWWKIMENGMCIILTDIPCPTHTQSAQLALFIRHTNNSWHTVQKKSKKIDTTMTSAETANRASIESQFYICSLTLVETSTSLI